MTKKIAILGSTGSIGTASLNIFKKDLKKFKIVLLSANSNYSLINKQIKIYKPKYFIITDRIVCEKIKKKYKKNKVKIYNKFSEINLKKIKFDITISAIVGIAGFEPTVKFVSHSHKILLANKETIICGWHIIKNLSKNKKSEIIPIDSEHFSINQLTKNFKDKDIEKIYITASGGPFLNKSLQSFKSLGWQVPAPSMAMYLWMPLPDWAIKNGWDDEALVADLLEKTGIALTPGSGFGEGGRNWLRLALVRPENELTIGLERIRSWWDANS